MCLGWMHGILEGVSVQSQIWPHDQVLPSATCLAGLPRLCSDVAKGAICTPHVLRFTHLGDALSWICADRQLHAGDFYSDELAMQSRDAFADSAAPREPAAASQGEAGFQGKPDDKVSREPNSKLAKARSVRGLRCLLDFFESVTLHTMP